MSFSWFCIWGCLNHLKGLKWPKHQHQIPLPLLQGKATMKEFGWNFPRTDSKMFASVFEHFVERANMSMLERSFVMHLGFLFFQHYVVFSTLCWTIPTGYCLVLVHVLYFTVSWSVFFFLGRLVAVSFSGMVWFLWSAVVWLAFCCSYFNEYILFIWILHAHLYVHSVLISEYDIVDGLLLCSLVSFLVFTNSH